VPGGDAIIFHWPLYNDRMWLVLTFLSILSRAVYGVLTKVLSNQVRVGAMTQSFLLLVACTVCALAIAPFVGGVQLEGVMGVWPGLLIAIITSTLGNIFYFKGISKLESATTQVVFSSIVIWSLFMAMAFLGTRLSPIQGAGVALMLAAILLAQYQGRRLRFSASVWLIVLSAACFAAYQIASAGIAKNLGTGTFMVVAFGADAILMGLVYWKEIRRDLVHSRKSQSKVWTVAFITGAASTIYNVFAYLAYRVAPDAGVVVLLLTSQVVFAVIISIVFLGEREGMVRKLTAGVIAVVAAVMIKA
jgi:drug/metabolite transporter (DMT)-like permease